MEKKFGHLFEMRDENSKDLVGAFKYSWADFLDEDEAKEFKDEIPEIPQPPEFLPLDKATRMMLSKEELEDMYNEEVEKQEKTM